MVGHWNDAFATVNATGAVVSYFGETWMQVMGFSATWQTKTSNKYWQISGFTAQYYIYAFHMVSRLIQ